MCLDACAGRRALRYQHLAAVVHASEDAELNPFALERQVGRIVSKAVDNNRGLLSSVWLLDPESR